MQPHLVRWQDAFRDQPVTILYVADGRRTTADAVEAALRADGVRVPVLLDVAGTMNRAYGVQAYPTAYVIGPDGRVTWQGIPHFDPSVPERAIRAALAGGARR